MDCREKLANLDLYLSFEAITVDEPPMRKPTKY